MCITLLIMVDGLCCTVFATKLIHLLLSVYSASVSQDSQIISIFNVDFCYNLLLIELNHFLHRLSMCNRSYKSQR